MNPLALVGGGTNALAILGIIVSLGGGAVAYWHEHDVRLLSEAAAKEAVVAAQQTHEQDQRTIAGLTSANALAVARSVSTAQLKEAIHAAAPSSACATSAPVRAVVIGLRSRPNSGAVAPAVATGPGVAMPAAAAAASR